MIEDYLAHHGILGMKWGVRRYQNEDGTLTELGRRRLEKKDMKWAKRNEKKFIKKYTRESKRELKKYERKELSKSGKIGKHYINAKNQKLAELMNSKVGDLTSPSGKVVRFVAKRGEEGVYMALATPGYNMKNVRTGVYNTGRIAYKKDVVDTSW